jgi:hypothetical protein
MGEQLHLRRFTDMFEKQDSFCPQFAGRIETPNRNICETGFPKQQTFYV